MFSLKDIVELFDNHKAIIAALLIVIIAGTVAGSIWISDLQDSLKAQKDIAEERRKLLEEENILSKKQMEHESKVLKDKIDVISYYSDLRDDFFKDQVEDVDSSFINIRNLVSQLDSKVSSRILKEINTIEEQYKVQQEIIDSKQHYLSEIEELTAISKSPTETSYDVQNFNNQYLVWSLLIFVLASGLIIIKSFRRKKRTKKSD